MNAAPAWMAALAGIDEERLVRLLRATPAPLRRRLSEEWRWQAHGGQAEPGAMADGSAWRVWLIMAGRGFGKTRAGAEWVWDRARELVPDEKGQGGRIALVGATIDEVVRIMIEGESGLTSVARTGEWARWRPSRGLVEFSSGATGFVYSAERPQSLRGPQHHAAWCDEIAKWPHGDETWDNLMLGLRLGEGPRTVVTTTPKAGTVIERILRQERVVVTGGRTRANVHLPDDYLEAVEGMFAGTRAGRQELEGELIGDVEGALWSRDLIEASWGAARGDRHGLVRVVIGVDPPAGIGRDACGIVVCGLDGEGVGHVLEDATIHGVSPERWAARVCDTAARWGADRVVAEANQGGAMIETVLRAVERNLPIKLRHAREAKGKRAEPVSALFERGRVRIAGSFPMLEDELARMTVGGATGGRSPDRADAMVWALAELMLGRARVPRMWRM